MSQLMAWQKLEEDTAEIFRLFGYDVETNTKINSAQTDIVARSANRFKPNILIECKFHESANRKVGIDEVENFQARIHKLRNLGQFDQGYLVTNTDFTSTAKESLAEAKAYVFLSRYKDLINQLIDVDYYLKDYVRNYEKKQLSEYVDLNVVNIRHMKELDYQFKQYLQPKSKTKKIIKRKALGAASAIQKMAGNTIYNPVQPYSKYAQYHAHNSATRMLILLADFGGGKSTSFAHLMYLLAKTKLDFPDYSGVPIPLLLTLKNYNKVPDIESLLISFFSTELGYSNLSIPIFKKMNEMGMFVILLDGFDEMSKLVTPAERRLTFIEICKLLTEKGTVVLASRPGYFPDNNELSEILISQLGSQELSGTYCGNKVPKNCEIACLQLMDLPKSEEYIDKKFSANDQHIRSLFTNKKFSSLMGRPVLLNIVGETYEQLKDSDPKEISITGLYDIYTKKWIDREEDKGMFRLLINRESKYRFLVLLAIQMHEEEKSSIHFSNLNFLIQKHFQLTNQSEVDHFSHDIRTCSFLNRDDKGYYAFIHKSFQEYLIAKEFSLLTEPIYSGKFNIKFSKEIVDFIDFDVTLSFTRKTREQIQALKNKVVRSQKYEQAAELRDLDDQLYRKLLEHWPSVEQMKEAVDVLKEQFVALAKKLNLEIPDSEN